MTEIVEVLSSTTSGAITGLGDVISGLLDVIAGIFTTGSSTPTGE